ncbi:MAG: hypothetical protein PHI03_03045 [Bacteroidales bacterium]|nr:hypothetical protein [Bacteroidales bacterium]
METLLSGKNKVKHYRFFASLRFALKRMFDKTVENRNGFVNDKCLVFRGGLG